MACLDRRAALAALTAATLASVGLAHPAHAQGRNSARSPTDTASAAAPGHGARPRADTAVVELAPLEVQGSIIPVAAPRIGSGVPARVQILSRERIEAWEPRILPDVIAAEAGVSLYDDLGAPSKLNLTTRGFSAGPTVGLPPGVSVFLDGVRQNEADAQEVNFDLLPMEHVRRVELLSGTASLLGPNSLGGAINLITDRGEGPPHGEVEASLGAYGEYAGQAAFSTLARGWETYVSGGWGRERGWRDATSARQYNGFANLGRTGERRGFRVQAFAARARARTAGSLPESIFALRPATNFTAGDYEDLHTEQLSLSGYAPLGPGRASLTAYARRFGAERFNVNQPPDDDVLARTDNRTLGATADWRWAASESGAGLALRAGLDGAASWVHARIFGVPPAGADGGEGRTLTTDVRSPGYDIAGYALADLRLGRATFSGGARYDLIRIPFRDLLDPAEDATHTFHRLSPRGGASLDLGGGASVYASVGKSFRAPAILELGCADPEATCPLPFALGDDPPLKPVRATTYELGARRVAGALVLSGSVYRSEVRDEIFFVASERALLSGYFTNLDRTRREGVELSAEGAVGAWLSWYANYAFTRATFESPVAIFTIRSEDEFEDSPLAGENDVEPGDRLPLVPEHQAKAGALLRATPGISLGLDLRWIGRQWLRGDEANETAPLPAYVVANARAGVEVGPWELAATVTNLLDSRKAIFGTFNENRRTGELERFLTPLNARAVKLTLRRAIGRGGEEDGG
ncbi:MAG: TonB-dependent receptor [Gemmatimonadetes bacterium]|nr:TonB-dependent receptor [Gemmatimonadota bacterium]